MSQWDHGYSIDEYGINSNDEMFIQSYNKAIEIANITDIKVDFFIN